MNTSKRTLIIDTNLLLLLIIGAVEEGRHIRNSKRLSAFGIEDYDTVRAVMAEYDAVYITPYIATEISNLIDLADEARRLAYAIAQNLFCQFKTAETDLATDCRLDTFATFGLTDSSLIELTSNHTIFTNDNRLLQMLYEANPINVLPYEMVRAARNAA